MKKVVVMTTGGTIAMKYDPVTQGLIPAVSGDDLIEAVPALREIAEVEVVEFSNVPSGHITPQMMFDLAKMADRYAEREDVSGIVVTHGTDTLEETAYMLGLAVKTNKPVCLTGAMRGASETGPDGQANILAAVMVAASDEALGKGALLIFNDEIHAAAEVTKTHTTSCATFHSPGWGPIGHIYFDRVVFRRQPLNLEKICPAVLAEEVCLLKTYAGMDAYLFKMLAEKPVQGLIVEALGCGNVPPAVKEGIEYVRSRDIPVVLASRVHTGRVVPAYSYFGSARSMEASKIILGGELTGQKARIKLMLALGLTKDNEELRRFFDN
ncbi:asparaginase [uncultured Phascolarctobacterium sp.]|jgi:L-asparaginase|uniref:asparaginase n=1 Tax=uncultured Phascolarctobacterium sp. TaxID=512296 RepID=UPI0025956A14|nr:asparaginase [uncultured Phascolarctobacterium sp.]